MKAKSIICGGLVVCATLLTSNLYAQGSYIGGNVRVNQSGSAHSVDAERDATVHLGSSKIKNSTIRGNATISSQANVYGRVTAKKDAVVNVAGLNMEGSYVRGNLTANLKGRSNTITADKGATVHVGGAEVKKSQFYSNLNITTNGDVRGNIKAGKNAHVNVASLKANRIRVVGGNAEINLSARNSGITAEDGSRVYLSTAELDNVTFNRGVTLRATSQTGHIRAEKDATVSVASAVLENERFNGSFDLRMAAYVPGGIHVEKGADVEIGSFSLE